MQPMLLCRMSSHSNNPLLKTNCMHSMDADISAPAKNPFFQPVFLSRTKGSKSPAGRSRIMFKMFSFSISLLWRTNTSYQDQSGTSLGSKAFSGVSPPIPGVLYSFTSLFRRTPYFPGVSLNLLVFLVFTRFYWSSPLFAGVPYLNHQIFFKLHQLFLKLPITFIAMLDASMVAPYFQCYD